MSSNSELPPDELQPATRLVGLGRSTGPDPGFVNPPVVRGSTVLHDSAADLRERVRRARAGEQEAPVTYGRHGNPTSQAFLDALTQLEGGWRSWALPSGLSACTTALLALLRPGDHALVTDAVYGPTRHFCTGYLAALGVQCEFYPPAADADLAARLRPNTRLIYLESPGSQTFEVQDLPAITALARSGDILTVVDNTWATPLGLQPLRLGADVSIHAATKYIGGHADLFLGTLTAHERAAPRLQRMIADLGLVASPDDCWLALRGLRSLGARLDRHRATALLLMDWLEQQAEVIALRYPGRPGDPGHALWQRDFTGASGLFGFVLDPRTTPAQVDALVDNVRLFGRGYSWGGFESLLIPCHPERQYPQLPAGAPLLRVSAGLEAPADLIADLARAFEHMRAAARPAQADLQGS